MSSMLKNSFTKSYIHLEELPPRYADIVNDPSQSQPPHAFVNNAYSLGEPSAPPLTTRHIRAGNEKETFGEEGPPIPCPAVVGSTQPDDITPSGSRVKADSIHLAVVDETPPLYTGPAWTSCFFCCVPLAVLAIINSDKAQKHLKAGELTLAWHYSSRTKKFTSLAIIYGILLILTGIGLYFLLSRDSKIL